MEYSLIESKPITVTKNVTLVGLSPILGGLILSYIFGLGIRSENFMGCGSCSGISTRSIGRMVDGVVVGSSVHNLVIEETKCWSHCNGARNEFLQTTSSLSNMRVKAEL